MLSRGKLPDVLPLGEVHAVEVGRAAGVEPPTFGEKKGKREISGRRKASGKSPLSDVFDLVKVDSFPRGRGFDPDAVALLSARCVPVSGVGGVPVPAAGHFSAHLADSERQTDSQRRAEDT
ncbi:hypothetical protein EYF80_035035 [Liparis tanakae]|uniref:Uncharacterized protein n=1 Tax=Liparis tanakae TaxID=230148 RepID=A0A4Z2GPW7_9TELE|nr:hypothetical protein EYF80_035035 [Liparis tanakae]